mmetsp:Transcript_134913/g.233858  ORF Transcript_134913/g.233858 Transcript_134913/m.233858 type:complete len:83 (-) Transcript_134913:244-492(-)
MGVPEQKMVDPGREGWTNGRRQAATATAEFSKRLGSLCASLVAQTGWQTPPGCKHTENPSQLVHANAQKGERRVPTSGYLPL